LYILILSLTFTLQHVEGAKTYTYEGEQKYVRVKSMLNFCLFKKTISCNRGSESIYMYYTCAEYLYILGGANTNERETKSVHVRGSNMYIYILILEYLCIFTCA